MSKATHIFYLDGKIYGKGDAQYMAELFRDYVLTSDMYGKKSVEFRIERIKK